jgi:ADP-heptose:LPS heptosyltransferase
MYFPLIKKRFPNQIEIVWISAERTSTIVANHEIIHH